MKLLSIAVIQLLSSSCISDGASANKNKKNGHDKKRQITSDGRQNQLRHTKHDVHRRTRVSTLSPETEDNFEEQMLFWDEDLSDPPGPDEGWPHTEPFHLDDTFVWEIDEMNMPKDEDEDNKDLPTVHVTEIARPEGSETAYYTGVTHVQHVNNPKRYTIFWSAGRFDGGSNTYLTIDTSSKRGSNPFKGAQEQYIDEEDVNPHTWVSSFTYKEETEDGLKVLHYVLFSGGNNGQDIGSSKMYVFEEDENGHLMYPQLVWDEGNPTLPARSCLLADLGDIYDGNVLVSKAGVPDIVITGLGGMTIYSKTEEEEGWILIRSLPLQNKFSVDNPAGAASYMGVAVAGTNLLAISSRSHFNQENPDSPCVLYDYFNDEVVNTFSPGAETVSADVLRNGRILLGSGGQAHITPQPNLLFDRGDDESIVLSDSQLVENMPTSYGETKFVGWNVTRPEDYFAVLESGLTKTRQVKSFSFHGVEVVLEINSAQPCALYVQNPNLLYSAKILPIAGSEGYIVNIDDEVQYGVFARGGDLIVVDNTVHVLITSYLGNNTVYSFDGRWLIEESSSSSSTSSRSSKSGKSTSELI